MTTEGGVESRARPDAPLIGCGLALPSRPPTALLPSSPCRRVLPRTLATEEATQPPLLPLLLSLVAASSRLRHTARASAFLPSSSLSPTSSLSPSFSLSLSLSRSFALSSRPRSRFLPRPANLCFSFFPLTALFAGHRAVPRLFSPSAGTPPSNLHADLFVRIAANRPSSPSRPRDPDRCDRSVLTEIESRSLYVYIGRFRSIRATSSLSRLAIRGNSDFGNSRNLLTSNFISERFRRDELLEVEKPSGRPDARRSVGWLIGKWGNAPTSYDKRSHRASRWHTTPRR